MKFERTSELQRIILSLSFLCYILLNLGTDQTFNDENEIALQIFEHEGIKQSVGNLGVDQRYDRPSRWQCAGLENSLFCCEMYMYCTTESESSGGDQRGTKTVLSHLQHRSYSGFDLTDATLFHPSTRNCFFFF